MYLGEIQIRVNSNGHENQNLNKPEDIERNLKSCLLHIYTCICPHIIQGAYIHVYYVHVI